ncbi:MAG: DUF1257 domain-containing protein [Planctomycetota bacterium]|nr:MAG: DUF1257 domain-containing protein [Planctomycetota bacterium]
MSCVIVLTPVVVSSWPMIASAIMGAAASMKFALEGENLLEEPSSNRKRVETELANSEVMEDRMKRGERIVLRRDDVTVEFGRDERGRCTVCVSGERRSEDELRRIGEEVTGRVVQQFAYHRLVTELKKRSYKVVEEEVLRDESVRLRIRL